jgi:hypothetical protein
MNFMHEDLFIFACLCLATLRIYLEVIGLDLTELPISKSMGKTQAGKVHKMGLYLSIGYLILFAPGYLLN